MTWCVALVCVAVTSRCRKSALYTSHLAEGLKISIFLERKKSIISKITAAERQQKLFYCSNMLILCVKTSAAVVGPPVPTHSVNLWLRLPSVILTWCQTSLMQVFKTSRTVSRRRVRRRRRRPRVVFSLCKSSFTPDSCCQEHAHLAIGTRLSFFSFNIFCFETSKCGLKTWKHRLRRRQVE